MLQHGFSDSLETWREYGYVGALSRSLKVILIDARGHGASDKPHDPMQYKFRTLVDDVRAVLDAVGVQKCHFFGVSMGGQYGFGMARFAPERLSSLMIGACNPFLNSDSGEAFASFLRQEGPEALIPIWESQAPISDALKSRLRANDIEALAAMQRAGRLDEYEDSAPAEWLSSLSCPYQLIAGEEDEDYPEITQLARQLTPGKLISLQGINHLQSMQRIDLVLPYLESVFDEARERRA